jgi:hypothetical protein
MRKEKDGIPSVCVHSYILEIYQRTQFHKDLVQVKIAEAYKDLLDSTTSIEPVEINLDEPELPSKECLQASLLTRVSVSIEREKVVDIHQMRVTLKSLSKVPIVDLYLKVSGVDVMFHRASTKV